VGLAALLLDRGVEAVEVVALLPGDRRPDLPRLRLLIEATGNDHTGVLLETVATRRVCLVPRRHRGAFARVVERAPLHRGEGVALAHDELQEPAADGEILGGREVARLLVAVQGGVFRVQQRADVRVDAALVEHEGVAGGLYLVVEARLALGVLPGLQFDGGAAPERVRPALYAEGGRDESELRAPRVLVGERPLREPPLDGGGVAAHLVFNLRPLVAQQAEFQPGLVHAVGDGRFEIHPAQQVAEHLVDDGPLDHRVVERDPRELVQVVHPRALYPRPDPGHVDEEVGFEDDPRLVGRRVADLAAVLVLLGRRDEQFHAGLGVFSRLRPLSPQRHVDRVASAAVGPDPHLAEVALAVRRRHRPRLSDGDDRPPNVHAPARRPRRKTLSVSESVDARRSRLPSDDHRPHDGTGSVADGLRSEL